MTAKELMTASMRAIDFDDIQLLRYWRNLDHVNKEWLFKII